MSSLVLRLCIEPWLLAPYLVGVLFSDLVATLVSRTLAIYYFVHRLGIKLWFPAPLRSIVLFTGWVSNFGFPLASDLGLYSPAWYQTLGSGTFAIYCLVHRLGIKLWFPAL